MTALPSSFSVSVAARRRACVLDTPLALTPYGPLLAQRLSGEFDVWLVRELWQILDNSQPYMAQPDLLLPERPEAAASAENGRGGERRLRETLGQWDAVRTRTDLLGLKLHWIGDAVRESLLPPGAEPDLVPRFEVLASTLERRSGPAPGAGSLLGDCFRDAVALTVALTPWRAFLLTSQGDPDPSTSTPAEPALCSHLRAAGIHCSRLADGARAKAERRLLLAALARVGASELMWAGLELAAVHVLAPKAAIMPIPNGSDQALLDAVTAPEGGEQVIDWWEGAAGFWYPLQ